MSDMTEWEFAGAVPDGEPFEIDGLDVWKYQWRDTRERAQVEDPHYHQPFTFYVYELAGPDRVVRFAAGEFSNGIWGFYKNP